MQEMIVFNVEKQDDGYLASAKGENLRAMGDTLEELHEDIREQIESAFHEAYPYTLQIIHTGRICSMCGAIKYRDCEEGFECIGCGRKVSGI